MITPEVAFLTRTGGFVDDMLDRIEGARLNLGLTEAEAADALIGDGVTELADWYVNWLEDSDERDGSMW